jgi:hypothetical protein
MVTAKQTICGEENQSVASDAKRVREPPSPLSKVKMDPATNYAGQKTIDLTNITEGSKVAVSLQSGGLLETLGSYPFSWRNNYDVSNPLGRPLQQGDTLEFQPNLCGNGPPSMGIPVEPCSEMTAPEVVRPQPGDDFVIVIESAPGAKIRVFRGSTEIGNGLGPVISLTAPLQDGDTVTVIQGVTECYGQTGRRVQVTYPED